MCSLNSIHHWLHIHYSHGPMDSTDLVFLLPLFFRQAQVGKMAVIEIRDLKNACRGLAIVK